MSRQSGDVKLCVSVYVSGWVSERSNFESTWQGCLAADCVSGE